MATTRSPYRTEIPYGRQMSHSPFLLLDSDSTATIDARFSENCRDNPPTAASSRAAHSTTCSRSNINSGHSAGHAVMGSALALDSVSLSQALKVPEPWAVTQWTGVVLHGHLGTCSGTYAASGLSQGRRPYPTRLRHNRAAAGERLMTLQLH